MHSRRTWNDSRRGGAGIFLPISDAQRVPHLTDHNTSPTSTKLELLTANPSNLPGNPRPHFSLPTTLSATTRTRDYHLNWLRSKANVSKVKTTTGSESSRAEGRAGARYLRDWSGGGGGSEEKKRPPATPGVRGAGGGGGGGSGIARRSRRWRIGSELRLALGL